MKYCNLLPFVFLFFLSSQTAVGQSTIKGTVTVAESGEPLSGVNVYLSGTTFGSSTDETGHFTLNIPEPGSYKIVFSMVGFNKKAKQVNIASSCSQTINISLKENVQKLSEIEVRASNKKWKDQYKYFAKQFIGRTEWAEQVTVKNPWVLDFEEHNDILTARAKRPLKITNMALGYELYVDLVDFQWPTYRNRGGGYQMFIRFEEITPKSAQQELKWKKNRARSYLGSFNYFLEMLYNDNLDESDFSVQHKTDISPLSNGETKYELLGQSNISQNRREALKGFKIKRKVNIKYDGQANFTFNRQNFSLSIYKQSSIDANTKNHTFFVDPFGNLLNPISLITYGNWADARVAKRVPSNYEVGN